MNHYIDLTQPISNAMPTYGGDPGVSLNQVATMEEDGFSNFVWSTGMHSGTHVDGPMHLTANLARIAEIDLERFAGPGFLVNAYGRKIIDTDDSVLQHLPPGAVVLFYTGFDMYFNQKEYYSSYPVLSEATAHQLVKKKVKMIGIDAPSPDYAPYPVHSILLSNNVLILENLTNLSALLHHKEFEILAFPLKIRADSAPVRVVAKVAHS